MIDTIGQIPETIRSNHRRYLPGKTSGYDDDSPDQERRLLLIKHTGIWNEFKKTFRHHFIPFTPGDFDMN